METKHPGQCKNIRIKKREVFRSYQTCKKLMEKHMCVERRAVETKLRRSAHKIQPPDQQLLFSTAKKRQFIFNGQHWTLDKILDKTFTSKISFCKEISCNSNTQTIILCFFFWLFIKFLEFTKTISQFY